MHYKGLRGGVGSALRNAELLFRTFKPSYTLMFLNGQDKVQKMNINVNKIEKCWGRLLHVQSVSEVLTDLKYFVNDQQLLNVVKT